MAYAEPRDGGRVGLPASLVMGPASLGLRAAGWEFVVPSSWLLDWRAMMLNAGLEIFQLRVAPRLSLPNGHSEVLKISLNFCQAGIWQFNNGNGAVGEILLVSQLLVAGDEYFELSVD